jgi:hypothetical protein
MKFLTPFLFLIAAGGIFYWVINPLYKDIGVLREDKTKYIAALDRADSAIAKKNSLLAKYNSISEDDKLRLQKLLPESADNIRLLIDLSAIAGKYHTITKGIRIADSNTGTRDNAVDNKTYSALDVSFDIDLTYEDFLKFLTDLQQNLRLSDVSSVTFSSKDNAKDGNKYTYSITIKTYVMK